MFKAYIHVRFRDTGGMRRDTARNREALLAAARRVFEADGIDAPLESVAAEAGLSRTSLHRHFASRAELLAAIWEADVRETEADAERFASHPDAFVRKELAQELAKTATHQHADLVLELSKDQDRQVRRRQLTGSPRGET